MLDTEFTTIEEGIEKLKKAVSLRNQMGGALYWNVCNDECFALANRLIRSGAERAEVSKILD